MWSDELAFLLPTSASSEGPSFSLELRPICRLATRWLRHDFLPLRGLLAVRLALWLLWWRIRRVKGSRDLGMKGTYYRILTLAVGSIRRCL